MGKRNKRSKGQECKGTESLMGKVIFEQRLEGGGRATFQGAQALGEYASRVKVNVRSLLGYC